MERTRVMRALQGTRGKPPADLRALQEILVRFSRILPELPRVKEIDVNPFLASDRVLTALDARVILHDPASDLKTLPRPAIRPYPTRYSGEVTLRDGRRVQLRPIRPEDEPVMARFHGRLSEQTVYQRYFEALRLDRRVDHDRLIRVCCNDYDRTLALVAEIEFPEKRAKEIVAVARVTKSRSGRTAELSALVEDGFQGAGLGKELTRRLLAFAQDEGLEKVVAYILGTNQAMQNLCKSLGFHLRFESGENRVTAEWRPPNPPSTA
jgi:acetyltransferase